MSKKPRICITGGAGYVGHRVAAALAESGHEIIAVDIVTPEERGISLPRSVTFRKHDLRIPSEAEAALKGAEVVLHLAADIGPLTYMHEHQADILTNNARIDAAVYPAAVANGVKHIIYSSSSGVFQYPPKFPYQEQDLANIKLPSNVYFFSKLMGEYFCRAYAAEHDLKFTIVRYHNVYGPGEDSKGSTPGDIHVIPALIEKVLSGQYPLELLGDPEATRPFVYVDDAIEATVAIVDLALAGKADGEDYNIGNDRHYTIRELGELIWKNYGDDRAYVFEVVDVDADTSVRREVDISKIRKHTGWSPRTPLHKGLESTAKWLKERKKIS